MENNNILALIKEDIDIKEIIKENNLTDKMLDDEIVTLYSYYLFKNKCKNCKGIKHCKQDSVGNAPVINYDGHFYISYDNCSFFKTIVDENKMLSNLITYSTNLDNLKPEDLYLTNPKRTKLYKTLNEIYLAYTKGEATKGLFISGPYGCGKSFIMGVYAKKYASNGMKVVFAYFPDLVRQIKSSITTGNLEEEVGTLKSADVLVLDDFGGELMTPYIRDEILGAILQERMENHKLTFITSNLDKDGLHDHLSDTSRNIDNLKASRIEERINTLMDFFELNDINYRNK